MPKFLPEINEPDISLDLETCDPHLSSAGPGWHRRDGFTVGFAIATKANQYYFPVRHLGRENLPPAVVETWLHGVLAKARRVVFANAQYDLGWLAFHGIIARDRSPPFEVCDVQIAEALLDEENPSGYSLDAIALRRLGQRKDESLLRDAAATFHLDPKKDLWKFPPKYVGPYAEQDARLTYDIWAVQQKELVREDLIPIFELEQRVTPVLFKMGMRGVEVDLAAARQLNDEWLREEKKYTDALKIKTEDIWTTGYIEWICKKEGITPPRTEKGNDSFDKEFLRRHPNPSLQTVARARELNRLRSVYVVGNILEGNLRGRVFPNYVQLACDEGGTRSGRLAAKNHNIQQIPKRSRLVDARRIRSLYTPGPQPLWAKLDYNSQEPRLQVHYGLVLGLKGAGEARDYFAQGKKLYHLIQDAAGCTYPQAKDTYLAQSYGQGVKSLARAFGMTIEEAQARILGPLQDRCPFISELAQRAQASAKARGWVRTILGRKRHFNYWQSTKVWDYRREIAEVRAQGKTPDPWLLEAVVPKIREVAESFFGPSGDQLERAYTNKAWNSVIQGSAGDQTKLAMVELDAQGFDTILQVHDEVGLGVDSEKEALEAKATMENVIKLELPVVADLKLGRTW